MTGSLTIVGIGPGDKNLITPEVTNAINNATDLVGYSTYVKRVPKRNNLTTHETDNRVELSRAIHALELAELGKKVVIVSSGDPGVFAMASALLEALENGSNSWKRLDIQILPGITAMLAAAAQLGTPLGHDFCAINLSDNLKPWEIIEKRLRLSLEADFVISLYNPRSVARPFQFDKVLRIVNDTCQTDRLIIFAKSVTTPKQNIRIFNINEAKSEMVDMSTIVIIGSSRTRRLKGTRFVYTPRST